MNCIYCKKVINNDYWEHEKCKDSKKLEVICEDHDRTWRDEHGE